MAFPGERALSVRQRTAIRERLQYDLIRIGPKRVFSGCLDFAVRRGSQKAEGYAGHLFKEIFGKWPRYADKGPAEPLPGFLIEEWVAGRKKKPRKLEKPAPLLDAVAPQERLDANGFIEGTLMKPEDYDAAFR